jgi:CheY-like chemotaxis protein
MTELHRVSLIGFGAFERTTFDLFFRMSEQRARRLPTPGSTRPRRDRGYLQVAPAHHPELVLVNGDAPEAVRQAWRWPGRCVCIGARPFPGAIAHLGRPVHMTVLLKALDDLTQRGRKARARTPAPPPARPPGGETADSRVLVVDDNENTLRSMRRYFRKLGLAATFARTGEEALYRISLGRFELVLLDSRMPGISGFMTSRLIKTRPYLPHRQPPRVVLLARPEDAFDALRTVLSRCDARIDKPLRKQDILVHVQPYVPEQRVDAMPGRSVPVSSILGM